MICFALSDLCDIHKYFYKFMSLESLVKTVDLLCIHAENCQNLSLFCQLIHILSFPFYLFRLPDVGAIAKTNLR